MHETSKSAAARLRLGHFEKYLRGSGIDIGCGDDPLAVPEGHVRWWDKVEGDAQHLLGVEAGRFDFVYSSHCLEHLRDVGEALSNWLRVLRPGGYLYVVVPDYLLYEKQCDGFDFSRGIEDQTRGHALAQIFFVARKR